MKIKVEYEVPEGKYCNQCSYHYIDNDWRRRCGIFSSCLEQYGSNIIKCVECQVSSRDIIAKNKEV